MKESFLVAPNEWQSETFHLHGPIHATHRVFWRNSSRDLTPPNFSILGYLNSLVYTNNPAPWLREIRLHGCHYEALLTELVLPGVFMVPNVRAASHNAHDTIRILKEAFPTHIFRFKCSRFLSMRKFDIVVVHDQTPQRTTVKPNLTTRHHNRRPKLWNCNL